MANTPASKFGSFSTLRDYVGHFKANGISHDPKRGLQIVLDFQDYVGRRTIGDTVKEAVDIFTDNQFRSTICWIFSAALDGEMAGEIIRKLWWEISVRHMEHETRQSVEAEYEGRHNVMLEEIALLNKRLKEQDEAMSRLDDMNTKLQSDNDRVREALAVLKDFVN